MVLECPGCSRKEHTPGQPEHPEDALDRGYGYAPPWTVLQIGVYFA